MFVSRRRLIVRSTPLVVVSLALFGCAGTPVRPAPVAAEPPPSPPAVTPRRGPHASLATPADAIERLAWEAERRGVAKWAGIYAQEAVPNGAVTARFRAGEDFPAASVLKVPILMAVYEAWSANPARRKASLATTARQMIQVSSNSATNRLVDHLGPPAGDRWRNTPGIRRVNELIRRVVGDQNPVTRFQSKFNPPNPGPVSTNRGCPWELAQFMVQLSQREKEGDSAAREMLGMLRTTSADHRTRIPAAIPPPYRARVANKTGTLNRVVNDLALVETPDGKRYVLSILMEGVPNRARADQFCRAVTAACWKRWSSVGVGR